MNRALALLSGRALSLSELREKLRRRAAKPSDIDDVIAKLKDAGYLNDQRLAEAFTTARIENQAFGRMRVLRDLKARRVAHGLAEKTVAAAFLEVDEIALIERYIGRKFRGKDLGVYLQDERHLASAYRKLRAAGFSGGAAIRVLKRYAAAAELLEDTPDDAAE